jgi:hypothetical protein
MHKARNKPPASEATGRSFVTIPALLRTRMSARRPFPSDPLQEQISQKIHPLNRHRLGQLIGAAEILLEQLAL